MAASLLTLLNGVVLVLVRSTLPHCTYSVPFMALYVVFVSQVSFQDAIRSSLQVVLRARHAFSS